jgi:hypothetical protein
VVHLEADPVVMDLLAADRPHLGTPEAINKLVKLLLNLLIMLKADHQSNLLEEV